MFFQMNNLNYTFNVSEEDPFTFLHEEWNEKPTKTLSRAGFIALSVFLGLIMTSGFLNNFIVLVLFCKFKTLRTPVNMILLNISISDMLVCACGTTLSLASSVRGRWLLGKEGCMWYGFINSCFGIVSLISLVILSYERYSTLTVYNQKGLGYRKPLLAIGGSWLYSVIWTVPPLLGWSSYGLEGAGTSCSVSWTARSLESHAYVICLFVFCLGLPVTVMVYSYGRLFYAVRQVGKIRRSAARRREIRLLFMVITSVVCYLLCWMPYSIVAIMATFGQHGLISPLASVVPSLLAKSSTVINPVIYILMNKQFYKCFLILFRCEPRSMENELSCAHSKIALTQLDHKLPGGAVTSLASPCAHLQEPGECTPPGEGVDPRDDPSLQGPGQERPAQV
ncbi:teleost multiple tissue opsin 2b [Brachyhypopomus gauderio]|uniref:teleost multiple tissue opsin 2b n=1 Tax=Brachyhypopomus gauderio TaxID=698409 RepID=UPI0040411D1C